MKLAKALGKLSLVALAVSASPFAMADDAGWYVGFNLGSSTASIDDARITSSLLGSGFTTRSIVDADRDTGYKLYGGYQLNKNFALEGGYFDLGKYGFTANTLPLGALNGNIKLKGLNLDAVGTLPITEKFSVLGRIGLNHAEAVDSFSGTGAVSVLNPNPRKIDTNLKVGLGAQYELSESLAIRAELERYRINDAVGNRGDIDLVSIGLVYRFGGKTPVAAPARAAIAPEVVAVAPPEVQPEPKAVAPVYQPVMVSFSADSFFDFGKANVTTEGKQALEKFASDLRGTSYDTIAVTGHTDRIGSHAYNMKLSTHRAEAVQTYLVMTGGIPASKITAKGVNGSAPVTKPGECVGNKATKKLIACLQPDRRVDVDVSGTR